MSDKIFSLKELEHLLNIKAHTVRTWEKRYGIICPQRNEANVRCYTEQDKELLSHIILLREHGYKLRNLAKWSKSQIHEAAFQLVQAEKLVDRWLDDILQSTIDFNNHHIETLFRQVTAHYSFDCLVNKVLLPLFDQFNLLWLTGSVQELHEKFLGQLVCKQLIMAIENMPSEDNPERPRSILFSPDGHQKEYLLRIAHYYLRLNGIDTTYMGCNLTPEEIAEMAQKMRVENWYILLSEDFINVGLDQYAEHLIEVLGPQGIHLISHPLPRESYQNPEIMIYEGLPKFRQLLKEEHNKDL